MPRLPPSMPSDVVDMANMISRPTLVEEAGDAAPFPIQASASTPNERAFHRAAAAISDRLGALNLAPAAVLDVDPL